ncbi:MAG: hypothetical protein UV98_C0024G0002 [Parcubacteria group bacterium GW2011_GWB1_43_6]|nr:MAG: hypothetical protein UV98_C0024G0002 [Parcubacteria group bacterium GW2011_GWB1_43_6]
MPKKGFYFSVVISMLAALLPLFLGWVLLQRLAALQDEAESFAAEAESSAPAWTLSSLTPRDWCVLFRI